MTKCPFILETPDAPFHPGKSGLRVEFFRPFDRCRLKSPENWNDETGELTHRWIYSGGSFLVFGQCSCKNYKECELFKETRN